MKNLYTKLSILLLIIFSSFASFSQVLITDDGTTNPDGSAMLEIKSSDKGMLIPRLTTLQRTSIGSPVAGLLVYDTTAGSFFIYGKNSKGTNAWIDLSVPSGIWETDALNNVYLADTYNNVGIGTTNPTKKLVIQADNDNDTLMEVLDKDGKPLMILTPKLTKFYFNPTAKGIAGGFAVGRYATAKGNEKADVDTTLFLVTPDSTRVYTTGSAVTAVAGGFAVGRYATAKGNKALKAIKYFETNANRTRVYTDGESAKGVAGGFAVGRYATAKGENAYKYFYADIDSTRIYTNGGAKGVAGGFAVGRYATAKSGYSGNYMYMKPENYFIGDQSGEALQIPNPLGKYNTFFGFQAGMKDTIGGSNVFIGYRSGLNTTGDTEDLGGGIIDTLGARNVFLGYESGYNNEKGSDNVLLGYQAGHEITTAGNNISIGSEAGKNNTNNSDNIFLGRQAGYNHTGDGTTNDAINNIYIGLKAGYGDIPNGNRGSNNIFMGTNAGEKNKNGSSNVFLGYYAGNSNVGDGTSFNGNVNVFVGNEAGKNNEGGYANTYIGYAAGKYNDGNGNVCVGESAGAGNSTTNSNGNVYIGKNAAWDKGEGDDNVIIGHNAGRKTEAGKNNVIIGNNAGWNVSGTGTTDALDYNVVIGDGAAGGGLGTANVIIGSKAGENLTPTNSIKNVMIGNEAGRYETGSNKFYIANTGGTNITTGIDDALMFGDFTAETLRINAELNIYDEYSFPTTSGTSGQVLVTNGAGNQTSWQTLATGGVTAGNGLSLSGNQVQLGSNTSTGSPFLHSSFVNLSNYNMIFNMSGTGDFEVRDNNATCLFIKNDGNIGIGTSAPTEKLYVDGNISVNNGNWIGLSTGYINFDSTGDDIELTNADVGIGTSSPENRLQVSDRVTGSGPENHVSQIKNTNNPFTGNTNVLALTMKKSSPTSADNFITFFKSDGTSAIGAIESNSAGTGIIFNSSGADYAEYLEKTNKNEKFKEGDIVGIYGGKISKNTKNADMISAISTTPIILGNNPGKAKLNLYEKIAFMGQVPVNVIGVVNEGDYIIASGNNDGIGFAVSESDMKYEYYNKILGIAWESSSQKGVKKVLTSIGLNVTNKLLKKQSNKIEEMQKQFNNMQKQIQELKYLIQNK